MSKSGYFAFLGKVLSGILLLTGLLVFHASGQGPATDSASLRTEAGITTVTFSVEAGRIRVYVPDDIRPGDTISGTVSLEPAGSDDAERSKNTGVLSKITVYLGDEKTVIPENGPKFTWVPRDPNPSAPSRYIIRISDISPSRVGPAVYAPLYQVGGPPALPAFIIPDTGQNGRPLSIFGPFDGNSDNTNCKFGDRPCVIIAESPRKAVIRIPPEPVGLLPISISDLSSMHGRGSSSATGTFRNIGVTLSAPKTSLLKGEKTTVTAQVSGLTGIVNPVTVQLVTTGAVNMDGGNGQTVNILPKQVGPDGNVIVTRTITGVQPGAFNVTASVLPPP